MLGVRATSGHAQGTRVDSGIAIREQGEVLAKTNTNFARQRGVWQGRLAQWWPLVANCGEDGEVAGRRVGGGALALTDRALPGTASPPDPRWPSGRWGERRGPSPAGAKLLSGTRHHGDLSRPAQTWPSVPARAVRAGTPSLVLVRSNGWWLPLWQWS